MENYKDVKMGIRKLNIALAVTGRGSEGRDEDSYSYCFNDNEDKDYATMVRISDEMMYADKARYYQKTGKDRRKE